MTNTSRYGLIVLGLIIFSFTTPVILRYLSGVTQIGEETTSTGLFAVKTEPEEAQVYLGDKLIGNSPTNIQFLEKGTYNISVKLPGYFGWNKDLRIVSGQVTWINPEPEPLYMFKSEPVKTDVTGVYAASTFASGELIGLSDGKIVSPFEKKAPTKLQVSESIIESGFYEDRALIKTGSATYVYSLSGGSVARLAPEAYMNYVAAPNGEYYYLSSGKLFSANSNGVSSVVDTEVISFGFYGQELYYLKKEGRVKLYRYSLIDKNKIVLSDNAPCSDNCKIYVSKNKKIFIQGLGDLYKYELEWKRIGTDVQKVYFDTEKPELTFISRHEVNFYDFNIDKVWLIDRSSQGNIAEKKYLFRGDLGYLFVSEGNRLMLLEIDRRGNQNKYYYDAEAPILDFQVNEDGSVIYVRTKDKVTRYEVR